MIVIKPWICYIGDAKYTLLSKYNELQSSFDRSTIERFQRFLEYIHTELDENRKISKRRTLRIKKSRSVYMKIVI